MAGEGEEVVASSTDEAVKTLTQGFVASLHTPLHAISSKLEELQYVHHF